MSNLPFFQYSVDSEHVESSTRYGLRSHVKQDVHKDEDELFSDYEDLPFIEYKGRVEYYREFYDIAIACDTLM